MIRSTGQSFGFPFEGAHALTHDEPRKIVLALGGGGSRGLAHLGVFRVLEREGIKVDAIVGTSVGAIAGAAYAYRPQAEEMIEATLGHLRSEQFQNDTFRRLMFGANQAEQNILQSFFASLRRGLRFTSLIRKQSILSGEQLAETIAAFVPDIEFDALALPFAVPAIDLRQPLEVLIAEGPLRRAVVASCSLPGFFPPVAVDDMLLADVGVIGSVPVSAARNMLPGAAVIAVDLSTQLSSIDAISRGWEAIMRCQSIAARKLNHSELSAADVVIRPEIGPKYWSDFSELEHMVDQGEQATMDKLIDIRECVDGLCPFPRVKSG